MTKRYFNVVGIGNKRKMYIDLVYWTKCLIFL